MKEAHRRPSRHAARHASGAAALGLAACSPGPDYVRPAAAVPAAFKEAGPWQPAAAAEPAAEEKWWRAFGDPVLDGLEEQLAGDNQNLQAAEAQYRAARAALEVVNA